MLADFAARLAFGLIAALTLTSWRAVPLRFFRLQTQIALGILVLAALAQATSPVHSPGVWLLAAAAVCAYLATVCWGLGLPAIATALDVLVLLFTAGWMILASERPDPREWFLMVADRGASGLLLGATFHSMLLGHYYLIAPAMTITPLTRSLDLIVAGLGARCLVAGIAAWLAHSPRMAVTLDHHASDVTILAMRWGMGVIGVAVSVYMARRTAAIRSTQSATGILYITTIFVLFGELASLTMIR
jgi:predicted membrane channel-forming protein YqfA (hemolysin III family)